MNGPIQRELQGTAVEGSGEGVWSVLKLCSGMGSDSRYALFGGHLSL